jgi:hypothetical protein
MRRKYIQHKFEEVHLVFDRYDIDRSLKTNARKIRLRKQVSVAYRITDKTDSKRAFVKTFIPYLNQE